jgi:hypothetical protein
MFGLKDAKHTKVCFKKPTAIHLAFKIANSVRYHCGGMSEEVNSCILISYMVYLYPKHSLGYQQHSSPAIIIMHIYNWYHSDIIGIHYVHEYVTVYYRVIPLLFAFSFLHSLLLPICLPPRS